MTTTSMELWIEALRSGKYLQGVARLKRLDPQGQPRYCCLGVLVEVCAKHSEFDPKWELANQVFTTLGVSHYPPAVVNDWLGEARLSDVAMRHLAVLNDGAKLTFAQIADILEDKDVGGAIERAVHEYHRSNYITTLPEIEEQ